MHLQNIYLNLAMLFYMISGTITTPLFPHTRRTHLTRFIDPDDMPIYCQPWSVLDVPVDIQIPRLDTDCFQELPSFATDYQITLYGTKGSKRLGCPLRIPKDTYVDIFSTKVENPESFVQVFSGNNCRNITSATRIIRHRNGVILGPFTNLYNVLLFKISDKNDKFVFQLVNYP